MKSMRWTAVALSMAGFCALARAHEGHPQAAAQGQAVTFKGEVLDMACYVAHEAKGAKHMKCSKSCLLGGAPMGLLKSDGSVVLLLEDHSNDKPYRMLKEFASQQVEVTGNFFQRGGLPALVVTGAKEAK